MPAPEPTPADVPNPAITRAERRLRLLEEVTEVGMSVVRALGRDLAADREPGRAPIPAPTNPETSPAPEFSAPAKCKLWAEAYARASRAVRMTITLEARFDAELCALVAGETRARERRRVEDDKRRVEAETLAHDAARREEAAGQPDYWSLILDAAEREIESPEDLDLFYAALCERLEDDPAYENIDGAPVREVVERLCADLELNPDWSLWEGEGWAPPPPFSRPRSSPFNRPSRAPVLEGAGPPDDS